MKIPASAYAFLQEQGCVVVSSIDERGFPHSACKGIVEITREGRIFLFDLYRQITHQNILRNPHISITAFDEHKFKGFCLKGRARIVQDADIDARLIQAWEDRISGRLTQRLLKNIKEDKGAKHHPEALLPKPEYLIVMETEEIINLTPHHLIQEG